MEDFKNVAPLQEFDWDAFENGNAAAGMSKEQLEQASQPSTSARLS